MTRPANMLLRSLAAAAVTAGLATAQPPDGAPGAKTPDGPGPADRQAMFDPTRDQLVSADGPRLLWIRRAVEPGQVARAETVTVSYYTQAVANDGSASAPTEVCRLKAASWPTVGTARSDGAALLAQGSSLQLVTAGHPPETVPVPCPKSARPSAIRAVYADGLILQEDRSGDTADRLAPLWWVPLQDFRPDVGAAVRLSDEVGTVAAVPVTFFRRGDRIAWVDATRSTKWLEPRLRADPRLFVFDSAKGTVRVLDLGRPESGPGTQLAAFDGRMAATDDRVVDLATGRTHTLPRAQVVALLGGVLFIVGKDGGTAAVYRIRIDPPGSRELVRRFPATAMPEPATSNSRLSNLFLTAGDRLLMWDGTAWKPL